MLIRPEQPADEPGLRIVNQAAFERDAEANLVDALRLQASPLISLVAIQGAPQDDAIVGHILFSPVTLTGHPHLKIMGLAPMAVLPAHQGKGIGSALVRTGLEHCRQLGFHAIIVLGHAHYYPRFGFAPAAAFGITCEYDVAADAFMLTELQPDSLRGASGLIHYHEAFRNV